MSQHSQQSSPHNRSSNCSSPDDSSADGYGAPRSDVATVCSNSVVGDLDSVVGAMVEDQLPQQESAAAPTASQTYGTTSSAATTSGEIPPLHPFSAFASHHSRAFPHSAANMGPPLNRALLIQKGGGVGSDFGSMLDHHNQQHHSYHQARSAGSQSGGSVKSFGSITGSEQEDNVAPTTASIGNRAGSTTPPAHTESDCDGASLDVEVHSVATTRSLHSHLFEDNQPGAPDAAADETTIVGAEHVHFSPAAPTSPRAEEGETNTDAAARFESTLRQQLDEKCNPEQLRGEQNALCGRGRSRSPFEDIEVRGKATRPRRSESDDER